MEEQLQSKYSKDDEVSLKELLIKIQEFYKEVFNNWKLVILIPIPFILIFLYRAYITPKIYPAELTFMVNENEGNSMGGVNAILGQFGLGGRGGGKSNLDKMLELATSRKIIQNVIFEKSIVEDNMDYLANDIINVYDLHEKWEKDTTGLANFFFPDKIIADSFNKSENKVLKTIYALIVGTKKTEGILNTSFSQETGIMKIKVDSKSEALSIKLSKSVYENLSKFYVEKSVEKQSETYKVVKEKVDSIKFLLAAKEYSLASFKDSNRGLWTTKTRLSELRLQRDVQVLSAMYGESIKNLEIADFTLKNKTPFIQIIDAPIAPIDPVVESKLKAIFLGGFLGGFLIVSFIIMRKIYRDTMAEIH